MGFPLTLPSYNTSKTEIYKVFLLISKGLATTKYGFVIVLKPLRWVYNKRNIMVLLTHLFEPRVGRQEVKEISRRV